MAISALDLLRWKGSRLSRGSAREDDVLLDVAWVSKHAMERYRLHFPEAVATDVIAAIDLSLPLPAHLADALAGRRRRPGPVEGEARLLHPAGTGVFVLCALREEPERMYVKTYLRLDGSEQRRMARGWFLEPIQVLRKAFELGYAAARASDAPPLAVQASKAALEDLVSLAPSLGAPALGTAYEEQATVRIQAVAPVDAAEVYASAGDVARRVLADFSTAHPGFQEDLRQWIALGGDALGVLLSEPHIHEDGVQRGWVEPSGVAALLFRPAEAEVNKKVSVVSVPRRLRTELVGELPSLLLDVGGEDLTEAVRPVASPDAAQLINASELRVRSWGARARREAESAGIGVIPPAWLGELEAIDPIELAGILPGLGWRLGPSAVYGALRAGSTILLVRRAESADAATVVRCAVFPDPTSGAAGYTAGTQHEQEST